MSDALRSLQPGERVLVTGTGGFLGGHLARVLSARGFEVRAASRAEGFSLLHDPLPLDGVAHVFHLAAETGVVEAWDDPAKFFEVNAYGTVRVLDQCRRGRCSLTHVGAYIYGRPTALPIAESASIDANNPYAFSKWVAEQACCWYAEHFGVPATSLRMFNVYGPGQSQRFVIPHIVSQTMDPAREMIEVGDLAPRRDYLYVDDAVDAIIATVPLCGMNIFNVGSGKSVSVAEVVSTALGVRGRTMEVRSRGVERHNEIPDVVADISRVVARTGWRPRVSLSDGLRAMMLPEATQA